MTGALLQKIEEDEDKKEIEQGELLHNGVYVDGKLRIERAKQGKFKSLTNDQQITLERWTNQAMRDFPDVERFYVESIMLKCILEPEESKKYAEDNYHKIFGDEITSREKFNKIEDENDNVKKCNMVL